MASTPITKVDTVFMQTTAGNIDTHLTEIRTHLTRLSTLKAEFNGAVRGSTGNAIQGSFEKAELAGNNVATKLEDILNSLKRAGIQYDSTAAEARGRLAADNADSASSLQGLRGVEQGLVDNHSWQ
ncbi:MAG: hypothetical protein JWN03_8485 [Nocardia sp.]|uniref:WXG100 family type VII secretion target n=1 Tax=Nocardia sp. TaxID=1821 RepID=UPI002608E722|nr:WXG100 family type VII secretion target [Nocardia sp.]MCU1648210.1 hypothetical protein [Nocardia sp.]